MNADQMIRQADKLAMEYAGEDDRARLSFQVGTLEAFLRAACIRIDSFTVPAREKGSSYATVSAGDAEVLIAYEFAPAERAIYDVESRGVGPGCPASVVIGPAFVNSVWIETDGVFDPNLIARWEQDRLDAEEDNSRAAA